MNKRWLPLLLAGLVFVAGLALADEPAGQDEPPVRLKKKRPRGDDKPMTDPAKPNEKKKDDKKKDKPKAEPREAEPVTPQEEEKEVLQRVVKNVNSVVEKLAKNDLGEGTLQTQRDTLKDIESLIHLTEVLADSADQPQNQKQGGEDGEDQQGRRGEGVRKVIVRRPGVGKSQGSGQNPGAKSGGGSKPADGKAGSGKPGGGKPGGEKEPGGKDGRLKDGSGEKPGGRNGEGGNGGGGGDKSNRAMNRNADLYKDVWGHLPETLRAKMDAYSNPQPFLPKYDDLIKRYYRTIAEQGRRKGE